MKKIFGWTGLIFGGLMLISFLLQIVTRKNLDSSMVIAMLLMAALVYYSRKAVVSEQTEGSMSADKKVCTACGYVGEAEKFTKGSFGMEVVLWLCFLVPGFLYSIWRLTSKYEGCPKCKGATLIPLDSPMGKKLTSTI